MVCALLAGFALFSVGQSPPKAPSGPPPTMRQVQLVLLVSAKDAPKIDPAVLPKMQADHLKFLEGLYNERKALMVGPFVQDPQYRGLVVVDAPSMGSARQLLKGDPYLATGVMDLVILPWFTDLAEVRRAPKFLDLEMFWFGFLKSVPGASVPPAEELQKIQAGHMANLQKMARSGDLVMAGPMGPDCPDKTIRGIVIFRTPDRAQVEALVAQDPAVARGLLKLELHRWATAKGGVGRVQP